MPQILREHIHNFGKDEDGNDFLKSEVIFGHSAVAEGIVEWSKKADKDTIFERKTQWGLTLQAVANGENPHVQIMLNPTALGEFLSQIGPCTALCIVEYGISLTGPHNRESEATRGKDMLANIHLGQDDNPIRLYSFDPDEELQQGNILLGAVTLSEEGPVFYSLEELEGALTADTEPVLVAEDDEDEEFHIVDGGEDLVMCTDV